MYLGYARVSTSEQNAEMQIEALIKAGVDPRNIYQDQISGGKFERPSLQEALAYLREGDVLIVWKLDRLGRSLVDLIKIITELDKRGVGFRSLTENIDTTTPGGRLIFHVFGALAEFEREIIRERTLAGIDVARKNGRVGGRPKSLTQDQIELVHTLSKEGKSKTAIARMLNTSRNTIYRTLSA